MSDMKFTCEQQSAVDARGVNLLVSAAAGSGKTAVLTARIIKMLLPEDGIKPIDADKLLVVTFTRAAAGEMKERIEKGLKDELKAATDEGDFKRKKLIINQIKKLSVAKITTIDSFCQGLVKEYFHLLDIDPSFSVIQEYESWSIGKDIFEKLVSELYKEKDEDFLLIAENYCANGSEAKLAEMVFSLVDFTSSFPYPEKYITEKTEEYAVKNGIRNTLWYKKIGEKYAEDIKKIVGIYDEMIQSAESCADLNKIYNMLTDERDRVALLANMSISEAIHYIDEFRYDKFTLPKNIDESLGNLLKKQRDSAKKAMKAIPMLVSGNVAVAERFLTEKIYPFAKALCNITLRYIKEVDEYKRSKSVLDFSDVARLAYRLLAENEDVRNTQKKRYSEILIDEYQDTNYLQDGLFEMISNGNNLFMVGDMKQSIYRFRKSDPLVFRNKSDSYSLSQDAENRKIILSSNFRSRKSVIDAVNALFEEVMSRKVGELDYDSEQRLNAGNKEYSEDCNKYTAECIVISSCGEKTNSDKRLEIEAEFIAKRIRKLIDDGFAVYDNNTKSERKLRYSDIAVLMSSHKKAYPFYKKIFDKYRIDFSCESDGFFATPEIKLMMSLLEIIENPRRDIPMVAVMRSAVGGFSDDEIALLRACYPNKSFISCIKGAYSRFIEEEKILSGGGYEFGAKIAAFYEKLMLWREKSRFMSADSIVRMLYENTGLYAFFSACGSEDATANLRLFFDRARHCEKNGFSGMFKFLRQMERLEENERDIEGAKTFLGGDCVRIMTIHKSKGLEMPVVFLAGCGREFNMMSASGRMLLHSELGYSMDYISYQKGVEIHSPVHDIISNEIKMELRSEEMRKLYVALTRAREKLIVTAALGESAETEVNKWQKMSSSDVREAADKAIRFIDWIAPVAIDSQHWEFGIHKHESPDQADACDEAVVTDVNTAIDAEYILSYKYPYASVMVKSKSAVSDFKGTPHGNSELMRKPDFLVSKSSSGTEYGNAMHLILETLPVEIANDIEKISLYINKLFEEEKIDASFRESISPQKVYNFYSTDIGKRILRSSEVRKESEFEIALDASELYPGESLEGEKILLQGVIDCWFVENDEIVIVDYKTDKFKEIEEIHKKYDIQLELYAKALEKITKKRVKEKFIYLFSSETVVQC